MCLGIAQPAAHGLAVGRITVDHLDRIGSPGALIILAIELRLILIEKDFGALIAHSRLAGRCA
jgi:hypothetical protein